MRIYLNGEFFKPEDAKISVLDRGFLFGDGVYEVIPVYQGKPFLMDEHLQRLDRSLNALSLKQDYTQQTWHEVIDQLLADYPGQDQAIYLQVTRGSDNKRNHLFPKNPKPTYMAMNWTHQFASLDDMAKGVSAITMDDPRWQLCHIKSVNLLGNVLANQQANENGHAEALLVRDGCVIEGSSTNLFMVKNHKITTPPLKDHMLAGITREFTIETTKSLGFEVNEATISLSELNSADEIWISSSTREVRPVIELDGKPVAGGIAGEVWHGMMKQFKLATGQNP